MIAKPRPADFADAGTLQPFCSLLADGATFIALRPIEGIEDSFLYTARPIDPMADRAANDAANFRDYAASFEIHRHNMELGFATVFIMLSLTLLISAVWMGLTFANQLVGPIRRLIRATDEVASGNLYVQVPTHKSEGDLGHLGETFNKMTGELRQQHRNLIAANALERRAARLHRGGAIGRPGGRHRRRSRRRRGGGQRRRRRLLCSDPSQGPLVGRAHRRNLAAAWRRSSRRRAPRGRGCTKARRRSESKRPERLLNVRVTGDPQRPDQGSVITLDDISDLVAAQRSAAWADVARRIAHEIKNPLTPIQLSAERLKRRYGRHIVEGKDVFDQCTDTIIRQVDDIKRMVDEFSNFARMPKARLAHDDLTDCVRQAMFLARVGRPEIAIEEDLPADPVWAEFDRRLMSQALTNVLKNAGEGIDARGAPDIQGRIRVALWTGARGRGAHRRQRQRQRIPERGPPQIDRTLRDDPGRRHRARPADRDQDLRRPSWFG